MTNQLGGLTALGDPTRRSIFERLASRPRAVGELARDLPVSRPAVSQHLRVLKQARLVTDLPVGNRRFDEIKPREHNMLQVDTAESVFEPRSGGRVYDRGGDGSECQWGRVFAYEP